MGVVAHDEVIPQLADRRVRCSRPVPTASTSGVQPLAFPCTFGGHTAAHHFVREVGD